MAVERIIIDWEMRETDRLQQRIAVLTKWFEEEPGAENEKTNYRYNVENFDGGVVYLHRPAYLNKGCDFVVNCEPLIPRPDGKKYKSPRHSDVFLELRSIAHDLEELKVEIYNSLVAVYGCQDVTEVTNKLCRQVSDVRLKMRIDRVFKVIKWLFIEQDITDWNTSGREMLMNSMRPIFD